MDIKRNLLLVLFSALLFQGYAKETLREATRGKFLMGVAVNTFQVNERNPAETNLIKSQFSAIVPENCMKSILIHPMEDQYNFETTDKLVAFGEKNKQVITGHCLIWHSQLARWFCVDENGENVSPEVLKERMRAHIQTIVKRYKGRVLGYDVVNEAFMDNGSYRNSKFYQILGSDFIRLAFQYAQEADPEAELYYNDYSMHIPTKCDAVVELVKVLKAAGCRIDAVGMQGHMTLDAPSVAAFEASIQKLALTGVKVLITEWEVSVLPNPHNQSGANISDRFQYSARMDPYRSGVPIEAQQEWNKKVTDMFALFLKYSDVIDRVTVWGLNDGLSWRNDFPIPGRYDYPLLFDRENQPKEVVNTMIKMAKLRKLR